MEMFLNISTNCFSYSVDFLDRFLFPLINTIDEWLGAIFIFSHLYSKFIMLHSEIIDRICQFVPMFDEVLFTQPLSTSTTSDIAKSFAISLTNLSVAVVRRRGAPVPVSKASVFRLGQYRLGPEMDLVRTGWDRKWTWSEPVGTGTGIGQNRLEPKPDLVRTGWNRNRNWSEPVGTGIGRFLKLFKHILIPF